MLLVGHPHTKKTEVKRRKKAYGRTHLSRSEKSQIWMVDSTGMFFSDGLLGSNARLAALRHMGL